MDINICEKCHNKDCIFEDESEGQITCHICGKVYAENITSAKLGKTKQDYNEGYRPLEKPQEAKEPGVILTKKEKGGNKIIKAYQKKSKIDINRYKIKNYLLNLGVKENIIETALSLYNEIAHHKSMKGKKFIHYIAALYYYALRTNKIAQNYEQIAKLFPSITPRDIKKAFKSIKKYIIDNLDEENIIQIENNLVRIYIGDDQDKYDVKMLSFEIIKNINDNALLEGIQPKTISGLSLLLSYKLLNQKNNNDENFYQAFSNKTSISKSFEKIKSSLNKIIPEKYVDKIIELENIEI